MGLGIYEAKFDQSYYPPNNVRVTIIVVDFVLYIFFTRNDKRLDIEPAIATSYFGEYFIETNFLSPLYSI